MFLVQYVCIWDVLFNVYEYVQLEQYCKDLQGARKIVR